MAVKKKSHIEIAFDEAAKVSSPMLLDELRRKVEDILDALQLGFGMMALMALVATVAIESSGGWWCLTGVALAAYSAYLCEYAKVRLMIVTTTVIDRERKRGHEEYRRERAATGQAAKAQPV